MKKSKILLATLCLFFLAAMMLSASGDQEMETVTIAGCGCPKRWGILKTVPSWLQCRKSTRRSTSSGSPSSTPPTRRSFLYSWRPAICRISIETNAQSYLPQLVESKLAAPLDDVLAKYGKDITGNARDGHLAFGQYGGKQYAIPGSYSLKYFAQNIRMDWLDNLGSRCSPRRLDEFRNVARAFTFNDPDGQRQERHLRHGLPPEHQLHRQLVPRLRRSPEPPSDRHVAGARGQAHQRLGAARR